MMKIINYFHKYSRVLYFILGVFSSLFVGYVRYLTGPEIAFSIFYLFPIVMVSWFVGRFAGVLISILSTATWLSADLIMKNSFSESYIPYLNESFRLVVFLFVVYIITKLMQILKIYKKIAITDPLTMIANRRAFYKIANAEVRRVQRYYHPISIAYIDLDHFKTINDNFGHSTGDKLLQLVSLIIKTNIREVDMIARIGGDEFALLLPDTGPESAQKTVNKLQEKLSAAMNKNEWPVTFSIGVVTFNKPPESVDFLLQVTDKLMYLAKKSGKNMIKYKVLY